MPSDREIARRQERDARIQAAREFKAAVEAYARESITKAYVAAIESALDYGHQIVEGVTKDEDKYRKDLFQDLAREAQIAMTKSYGQLVTRQEGPASATHYRAGEDRLSGGILLDALRSAEFFNVDADGLEFGDVEFLNKAAKHWHRINFGAGGRGEEGETGEFPILFGNEATAIGFVDSPSPGFSMPAGFWFGPGGQVVRAGANARGADAFYPKTQVATPEARQALGVKARARPNKLRPTRGIEGKNFLNSGAKRLAELIPTAYQKYVDDLMERAITNISDTRERTVVIQGPSGGTSAFRGLELA